MQSGNNGNVQKPAGEIKIRMARKLHPIMQAMPRITKCHAKESMLSPEVVWRPAMGRKRRKTKIRKSGPRMDMPVTRENSAT